MATLHVREARPEGEPAGTLLCVHGFPESSRMWVPVLEAAAAAGWRAVAPDLAPTGGTAPDPPHTWRRHVEALHRLHAERDLGRVVLAVHDWGGLIGLRWACEAGPDAVRALVISDTGFFPDGKWHGLAKVLRTPGEGGAIAGWTNETVRALLPQLAPGMDAGAVAEYAAPYATEAGRQAALELYRSGDFAELEAYDGQLAALGVPALLLWGGDDAFAPVAGAHRFARELPDTRLRVLDGVGHFVFDDAPEAAAAEVVAFLRELA